MSANPPFASIIQFFQSFIPGQRLVDGGDCQLLVKLIGQVTTGITALAGGGLSSSTPVLQLGLNEVDTVATNSDSVQLPPAVPGLTITLYNATSNTLAIYGNGSNPNNNNTADVIIPHSTNTSATNQTLATALVAEFYCFKAGIWKMLLSA